MVSTVILRRPDVPLDPSNPSLIHYTCGGCGHVLASAEVKPRIAGVVFVCPRCARTNGFDEAEAQGSPLPGDPPAWSPALLTGHATIDGQHRQIFARIEALHQAMSRRERPDTNSLMDFLGAYVIDHFTEEERLMRDRAYPGYAGHLAQHSKFIRDFTALNQEVLTRGPTEHLSRRTRAWLVEWLRWHIMGADAALGVFLRTRR
ncbi:MAG: hemerythrin family protein [Anaeromyxobacteraceae bacterium]